MSSPQIPTFRLPINLDLWARRLGRHGQPRIQIMDGRTDLPINTDLTPASPTNPYLSAPNHDLLRAPQTTTSKLAWDLAYSSPTNHDLSPIPASKLAGGVEQAKRGLRPTNYDLSAAH